MRAEWIKVELSRNGKPLGTITFWNGELDLEDVDPAPERESLRRVFAEYEGKPFTYAWVGFPQPRPAQYEPHTVRWFEAILFHVLGADGYRYVELDSGIRPPRDTSKPGGA
jgi:hypothetical protein